MPFSLADIDILLVPGRGNSDAFHWMSAWAAAIPNSSRVLQTEWEKPQPGDWIGRLDAAIRTTPRRCVVIGHSLAVATIVKWADAASSADLAKVAGALLVSPTNVEDPDPSFDTVRPFAPMPMRPLPFPAMVLASRDDPRVTFARAIECATAWGAELVDVGELGHIGNLQRLGIWPEGLIHLGRLLDRIG
ncbi:RBBP9/YdeN family alpha/beta hydrolase [Pinisolibacter sp.]|uniref:RBBP9/YdeN family alpha/beta hydrolase n=1 Tax=Pinisolibacter sp. TaxID=2172024 RepID=UPI002FDD244A